jgi:DNA topoisomerase-3
MRLFIAEKPSLARAIAEALPGPHKRAPTHIACGDANVVAWCAGHILETAPPEAYGTEHKQWRVDALPITPQDWKLEVAAPDLLRTIQALLRDASSVVHAGDPDREGQLIVDQVLQYFRYTGPVLRLLVRDPNPEAIRQTLGALEPNTTYRSLYEAALARQRADWLYGMNMTRLYTLLGRAAGYEGVLSVGRVQTPLLGLIVARDRAIAEFRPVPYYALSAAMRTGGGNVFRAVWVPGPLAEAHLDPDKRLLERAIAEAAQRAVQGQRGAVIASTEEKKIEPPPLPYRLADLQMDAGRRLGLSASQTLEACQTLHETHRLTTYPRSDCAHLPEGHHGQAADVVACIARHAPALAAAAAKVDVSNRSKAWNDKKISAHHAIIPTPSRSASPPSLTDRERAIYELIARRYLAQFYPNHEYLQTKLELVVAGETFSATGVAAPSLS